MHNTAGTDEMKIKSEMLDKDKGNEAFILSFHI